MKQTVVLPIISFVAGAVIAIGAVLLLGGRYQVSTCMSQDEIYVFQFDTWTGHLYLRSLKPIAYDLGTLSKPISVRDKKAP